ncbi:hypothetical protein L3Y34_017083 [Caenorhabditis briggsae]|uniref:Zer-1-like leucine-rich repeats region domain-containing protein n=1 Tax=Caenorhabditis briggsae TaxID=6238 RepID=A0AAE9DHZ8_CAEBR|nr:hypothetical protein L3Y34_017083 [Caenorhabditis briggsae]
MFPTLFQLAAKSAAQGIHNDNIPIDFSSDTKSSNAVVRELLELDPKNIEKLKTHKNQLSRLRELDLRKCEIDGEGISNLKNFTLNSLDFGELHHLKAKFPVPIYYGRINIVSLLERALNAHSQEMIIHLEFSGMEEFQIGWEEKISKLLPSLQSIKIIHKVFSEPCGFSNLCISFPNLRTLDISSARCVSTLKGIQNIKSLQKLVMRNVRIEDSDGYKELSELKNLRVLVVSDEDNRNVNSRVRVIRSLLQAEVRMPSLEFLDCSMTSVEDHELKLFVEHHPSLKTVVAISTRCENSHISTINLLNCLTTHSSMKSLEYAISNDRDRLAESCIVFIGKKLNIIHNQLKDSEISEFLNTLCYVLKESKNDMVKAFAISCFSIASFFGWVIDTNGFRNPSDKSRALMFCSTLSILLAKNLIVNREDVNTKIKDFNDSWGQSSLLDCPKMSANVFKTILNSEHSTDQSIHFGFLLMHTYINVECFLESKELWNWMKTISEWYRNSRKATKNTRESTAAILDEMRMVEKQWWSQFLPVSEFF